MPNETTKALEQLIQLEKEARSFGFDWPNRDMVIDQVLKECEEVKQAIHEHEPPHRIQEEVGDLIHAGLSLCLFCGYDVEQTLSIVTEKFKRRMDAMKASTHALGLENLQGQSIEFMIELWNEVKKGEIKSPL